ncbi:MULTISPECIES: TetR/AcrR family transcriptional regulator [Lactobacillaceae]|uniref:TetR/AcrR family transcriptional regulator n=1 Tax=Lactobacillaceae TaxID=33958 RepID=UPI0014575FED|nr:TetR/AcrR family transcriptional regulator [Lactobacillus sp. HBUAS51381]NLR08593.1 TetR/AcrR family transcriptional regulator [Lactobacillus sp. HBUAS51381]
MRKDAQQNRDKILTTAAKLFQARTVAEVSMKDIATAAEIGPGTLYRHYSNKNELCSALSLKYIDQFLSSCQDYLRQTTATPVAQFNHVLTQYILFRERRLQLLAFVETGPTVMDTYYRSELYHQLVQLFKRVLKPVNQSLNEVELTFQVDMLIAMLKSDSYAFQRHQRDLSQAQLGQLISHLMVPKD